MTREEAMDVLKRNYPSSCFEDLCKAVDIAIQALSAQPEQKKGKWIDNTYCSECGWVNQVESGFIGSVKGFNFCPNCGADMRRRGEA